MNTDSDVDAAEADAYPDLVNGRHPYDNAKAFPVALRALSTSLQSDATHTPEEADRLAGAYAPHLAQLAVNDDQATSILSAVHAAARSRPTAEQRADFDQRTREALVQDFGQAGAAQALRDAKALLAKVPRLQGDLQRLGIDGHPQVLRVIANRASLARQNGRLA